MSGGETKWLVGSPSLGSPTGWSVKNLVQKIKQLGKDFAQQRGDLGFLRDIERAMDRENATVQKRVTARQSTGRSDNWGNRAS